MSNKDDKIRLQKFLSDSGISSRRQAELFILAGRVKVNGEIVRELGVKVNLKDKVEIDGKAIKSIEEKIYFMLNKPIGYLSTVRKSREKGKTVLDLVKTKQRIFPVGRLDKNSSGLLILTNDGDLTLKLTHPRFEKEKEYIVEVDQPLTIKFIKAVETGINLEEGKTLPAKIKKINSKKFSIILKEGKKRQIRRIGEKFGLKVLKLHRVRINKLKLGNLPIGKFKQLTIQEIKKLI